METTLIALKLLAAGAHRAKKSPMRKASVRLAMAMAFLSCEADDDDVVRAHEVPALWHNCQAGLQSCAKPFESLPVPTSSGSVCTQAREEADDCPVWESASPSLGQLQAQCHNNGCE